jgi:isopenicillin N synthase-like dioxygenase
VHGSQNANVWARGPQLRGGDLGTIRFIRYPPSDPEPDPDARGISAHTDFEFFTLMHQDKPGLQFMLPPGAGDEAGQWIDAPVRPESYVIIVGDMLERFTNGLLHATPHRVLPCPWQRHSIIRFVAVHPETLVEPMEQFITDARPRAYTAVTMHKHMETTLSNLAEGKGAWDMVTDRSITATYVYDEKVGQGAKL